jgi:hypothetical protein
MAVVVAVRMLAVAMGVDSSGECGGEDVQLGFQAGVMGAWVAAVQ